MGTYIDNPLAGQPFSAPNLSENHHVDLIEEYRASERGDHRAIAALLTIERECAELKKTISADPIPQPVAAAADPEDRSVDLRAISRESAAYRKSTGNPHAVPPWRQYRAGRCKQRRSIPPKRRSIPAKPNVRPTHDRARRSSVATARKTRDGGGDSGDGPPGTTPTRVFLRPDGTARIEVDDGPDYALSAEFATVSELVQYLLDYETWAQGNGTWIGPSYLDPNHPAYPIICMGLN
jgi:hypothetical protein